MKIMRHIPQDDILRLSINLYEIIGESMSADSTIILTLYRFFNIIVMSIIVTAIAANLFYVEVAMYIQTIEGLFTVFHVFAKYLLFLYYKYDMKQLLIGMLYFWNHCDLGISIKLKANIDQTYKLLKTVQNCFLVASLSIIGALLVKPAFGNSIYSFDCWVPDSIVLETVVLFSQSYFLCMAPCISLPYDSMYVSYSLHVIMQLHLLQYRLENLAVCTDVLEVYACIEHHQFLLSIVERMNKVYFWTFLFHYFVTLVTGCTQLYIILLGNVEIIELVSISVYIIVLLVQFAYWSFPAEEIAFQLSNISNAIYMSSWYRNDGIVMKTLLTMMRRAQRQKFMSAGGLMDMNIDAFGSVVRKIFSFYAILKNVLNK